MNISTILKQAESGLQAACNGCKWNPNTTQGIAFGTSCRQHGIDWSIDETAISIQIVQDPANTTPQKTGKLCFVCNSKNPSDQTAQNAYALWRAAVALGERDENSYRYLDKHYWTNAIMHGVDKKHPLRKTMEAARKSCTEVLLDQINNLLPKVIIANGKEACKSLYDLNLITNDWDSFKVDFSKKVYRERTVFPNWEEATIFCTYHTSAQVVNTHIGRLYSSDTEVLLSKKLETLIDTSAIKQFLNNYPTTDNKGRGMRVLLLHWLDIGEEIRKAQA